MSALPNPPDLDTALKSLWGATQMPFAAAVEIPYLSDTFQALRHRLEQLVAVRAGGLLHGPNGVGKTVLLRQACAARKTASRGRLMAAAGFLAPARRGSARRVGSVAVNR